MQIRTLAVWTLGLALLAGCSKSDTPKTDGTPSTPPASGKVLRITAIPDNKPDLMRERQDVMAGMLKKALGVDVEFRPVEHYQAAVVALLSGQADLAFLGGVTTVQAMQNGKGKDEVMPLVTREEDLKFKSYVIARADLNANSIQDLKGKRFTFGAKTSTSGHVMARHMLVTDQKIVPEEFFASVAYSGAHSTTAENVQSGAVDAGALNYLDYDQFVRDGKIDPAKVKIVWTTPEYVDYSWTIRKDVDTRLGAGTTEKIKNAFLALDPAKPEDAKFLAAQNTKKFVAAEAKWWNGIADVLAKMDLNAK